MEKDSFLSIKTWYNLVYWNQESLSHSRSYQTYYAFLNYLDARPCNALLDVGAGGGKLLKAACERNICAFGVDLSETGIDQAKSFAPSAHVAVANGERLPFPDSSFDYLTCLGSLEHFLDIEAGLDEMVRVCKNEAKLCIMVPNSFYLFDIIGVLKTGYSCNGTLQPQERLATRGEWQDLIETHGLSVLAVHRDKEPINTSWRNVFSDVHPFRIINRFIKKVMQALIPLNLGYQFIFICSKSSYKGTLKR